MVTDSIILENGVNNRLLGSSISDQIGRIFSEIVDGAPGCLSEVGSAIVGALKINSIKPIVHNQRDMFLKRRQIHSEQIAGLANLYFCFCKIPIRFWSRTREWRDWEIFCFRMFNGDNFQIGGSGPDAIIQDRLPGKSLWDHLQQGTLTPRMLQAAARELHRAHQFWSAELDGLWSHGDATAANIIYDESSDRARLIDFETHHDRSIPAEVRHADDLLTLLLDIVGHVPTREWMSLGVAFVKAYQDQNVIGRLRRQLVLPRGLAWIWWAVRTGFTNPSKVRKRLQSLRHEIVEEDSYESIRSTNQKPRYPIKHRIPQPAFLTTTLANV